MSLVCPCCNQKSQLIALSDEMKHLRECSHCRSVLSLEGNTLNVVDSMVHTNNQNPDLANPLDEQPTNHSPLEDSPAQDLLAQDSPAKNVPAKNSSIKDPSSKIEKLSINDESTTSNEPATSNEPTISNELTDKLSQTDESLNSSVAQAEEFQNPESESQKPENLESENPESENPESENLQNLDSPIVGEPIKDQKESSLVESSPLESGMDSSTSSSFSKQEPSVSEVSKKEQDFSDVEHYANTSSSHKGLWRYDLQISGVIDSAHVEKQVMSILENSRLRLSAQDLLSDLKKDGILVIKNINLVKAMYLVSQLMQLPVQCCWRQYIAQSKGDQ